jgi:hypothetical protein
VTRCARPRHRQGRAVETNAGLKSRTAPKEKSDCVQLKSSKTEQTNDGDDTDDASDGIPPWEMDARKLGGMSMDERRK